jgi:acyl carrier protein
MPYDLAIQTTVESVLGPLPQNTNINTTLEEIGVTEENLYDIYWAIECRFDVNTSIEELQQLTTVGEAWAYWKAKIAEDPENNPEVP